MLIQSRRSSISFLNPTLLWPRITEVYILYTTLTLIRTLAYLTRPNRKPFTTHLNELFTTLVLIPTFNTRLRVIPHPLTNCTGVILEHRISLEEVLEEAEEGITLMSEMSRMDRSTRREWILDRTE